MYLSIPDLQTLDFLSTGNLYNHYVLRYFKNEFIEKRKNHTGYQLFVCHQIAAYIKSWQFNFVKYSMMSNIYREKDESWNNMGEFAKIQKLGEDIIIVFPKEVVEKLNLEEGCQVEIESFVCCGTSGVRIKSKTDIEI
jgi:hypothetical protein